MLIAHFAFSYSAHEKTNSPLQHKCKLSKVYFKLFCLLDRTLLLKVILTSNK